MLGRYRRLCTLRRVHSEFLRTSGIEIVDKNQNRFVAASSHGVFEGQSAVYHLSLAGAVIGIAMSRLGDTEVALFGSAVELALDFFFREPPRLLPEHVRQLLLTHVHLLPYGHEAVREVVIVLSHQAIGHHEVVYVLKDKGLAGGIGSFRSEKSAWVVAPVAERVEVVRGMPTIIEAVTIAL